MSHTIPFTSSDTNKVIEMNDSFVQLRLELRDDINICLDHIGNDEARNKLSAEQQLFWYRSLIRCFFAYVEATAYSFRQLADLVGRTITNYQFTVKEREQIDEQKIKSDGTVKSFYLAFNDSIRVPLKLIVKIFGKTPYIDEGKGWQALLEANIIRGKLMHPKSLQDIHATSEKDVDNVIKASQWFDDLVETAQKEFITNFQDFLKSYV